MSLSKIINKILSLQPDAISRSGADDIVFLVKGVTRRESFGSTEERDYVSDKVGLVIQEKNYLRIRCSNLAMRFYQKDGWTAEKLESVRASSDKNLKFFNDKYNPYYVALDYGYFDAKALSGLAGKIIDSDGNEVPERKRVVFIEGMN